MAGVPGLVGILSSGEGVSVELGIEQHVEGAGVLDADLVVLIDVDLGEQCLVAQAAVELGKFPENPVLLSFEEAQRDGVCVVGLEWRPEQTTYG